MPNSIKIGMIGFGQKTKQRITCIQQMEEMEFVGVYVTNSMQKATVTNNISGPIFEEINYLLEKVDLVFIALPTMYQYEMAVLVAQAGKHFFLEWQPTTSVQECEMLIKVVEEAGIEAGVSNPQAFHPLFEQYPEKWFPSLVQFEQSFQATKQIPLGKKILANALQLCTKVVKNNNFQKVDVAVIRNANRLLRTILFGIRFQNGAYVQLSLRNDVLRSSKKLFAGNDMLQFAVNFKKSAMRLSQEASSKTVTLPKLDLIQQETRKFLTAIQNNQPIPYSILEARHTMRLVEKLLAKLR